MNAAPFSRLKTRCLWLLALLPALCATVAQAQQGRNLVGDETVVASLNPPPANLSCTDAAAQTSVYFNFAHPKFQVTQLSLYLDGQGVDQNAIDEHWPTITFNSGLHAGRNVLDLVATGADGQTMDRRLIVQIGPVQENGAVSATVACDDAGAVAQAPDAAGEAPAAYPPAYPTADGETGYGYAAPPPATVEYPQPAAVAEEPPAAYVEDPAPVYADYPAPVYIYNPYPVMALDPWVPLVPFYSFGFFYSHYHPYCPPPVYASGSYYGGYGGRGGGYYGGGYPRGEYRGGYSGGYAGGYARGGYGGTYGNHPAYGAQRGYNTAAPYTGNRYAPPVARAYPQQAYAPRAYAAPVARAAPQYRPTYGGGYGGGAHYAAPAPQFRGGGGGAPAFHGGGAGAFHGFGGGGHGGGGHHR